MAFQTAQVPFKLTPQDMGRPDILGSISKGIQVGYQPAMAQADIFHKTISPLATIASNPLLWSVMGEDQQKAISNMIGNMLSQSGFNTGTPGTGGGGLLSNLGASISNLFGGRQPEQQPMLSQENRPTQQLAQGNQQNDLLAQPGGRGTDLSPTHYNQIAGGYNIPGTTGGVNPLSVAKAQQAGLETTATTEAQGVTEKWNSMLKQGKEAGEAATAIQNNLDKVYDAYQNLEPAEKGPLAGRAVALSTAAQDVDQGSAAIADSLAGLQQSGHITQADRQIYGGMKPGRYSTDTNMEHQKQFITGLNLRLNQSTPFTIVARAKGLSPEIANAAWQYYVSKTPIYDVKTHKYNPKIMDWEDYLEPKNLLKALSPRARKNDENEQMKNSSAVANQLKNTKEAKDEGLAQTKNPKAVEGVIQEVRTVNGQRVVKIGNDWYHA